MSRPRILDLFCGAGGAAMGYHRAGFDVVGVDIAPQPNYPFEFVQADALTFLQGIITYGVASAPYSFAAIHASPPCQSFSAYRRKGHGVGDGYPDLIDQTRQLLQETGLPYLIENVPGAPLIEPMTLCGSMFGLEVRRHRLFECSFDVMPLQCHHELQRGDWPQATNRKNRRRTAEIGVWRIPLEDQKRAIGVDWDVTLEELSEMVPPAYTHLVGTQLRVSALAPSERLCPECDELLYMGHDPECSSRSQDPMFAPRGLCADADPPYGDDSGPPICTQTD